MDRHGVADAVVSEGLVCNTYRHSLHCWPKSWSTSPPKTTRRGNLNMRAATYTRYSSDRQNEASTADQRRLCRARAERESWTIAGEWSDEAISGSTPVAQRPGAAGAIAAGMAGAWDILIVEALDRLSRDSAELELTVRRLEHRQLRIVGVSDGYDSAQRNRTLMRGMRGLMAQQYLEDLAERTRRGLTGQVLRGFHAGGKSYGYRTVAQPGGRILEVYPDEGVVVQDIYRRYADGHSCQRIASDLNARAVRGPRGTWSVSALYGSPAKGTGILNNELYRGVYLWGKTQWIKHPDTGRRERFERPAVEWQRLDRPDLRLIDEDLWQRTRLRMGAPGAHGGRGKGGGPKPTTLFGGLLRCGKCGGSMIAVNANRYGCANRKDRGRAVCTGLLIPRAGTDRLLLAGLKADLLSPTALAQLQSEVKRLLRRQAPDPTARLTELEREIARLVDAIAAVGISPALAQRLQAAEAERASLQMMKRTAPVLPTDRLIERYRTLVADLEETLHDDVARARTILAEIIGRIDVVEEEDGIYAAIGHSASSLALVAGEPYLTMVAGAGLLSKIRVCARPLAEHARSRPWLGE